MVERKHTNLGTHINGLQEQADFRGYALKPLDDGSFQLVRGRMQPAVFGGNLHPNRQRTVEDSRPKPTNSRRKPSRAAGVYGPCGPRMPDYLNQPPRNKESAG